MKLTIEKKTFTQTMFLNTSFGPVFHGQGREADYQVETETQLSGPLVRKGLGGIPFLTTGNRDRVRQVTGKQA